MLPCGTPREKSEVIPFTTTACLLTINTNEHLVALFWVNRASLAGKIEHSAGAPKWLSVAILRKSIQASTG